MNAEGVQQPIILLLLMAKDVEIVIIGQNLETLVTNTVPLIKDLSDFEDSAPGPVSDREPEGSFIGFVAGVALDLEAHTHGNYLSVP
jgi:hypothetical protein